MSSPWGGRRKRSQFLNETKRLNSSSSLSLGKLLLGEIFCARRTKNLKFPRFALRRNSSSSWLSRVRTDTGVEFSISAESVKESSVRLIKSLMWLRRDLLKTSRSGRGRMHHHHTNVNRNDLLWAEKGKPNKQPRGNCEKQGQKATVASECCLSVHEISWQNMEFILVLYLSTMVKPNQFSCWAKLWPLRHKCSDDWYLLTRFVSCSSLEVVKAVQLIAALDDANAWHRFQQKLSQFSVSSRCSARFEPIGCENSINFPRYW